MAITVFQYHLTSKMFPFPRLSPTTPSELRTIRVLKGLPELTLIETAVKRVVDEVLPNIVSERTISFARDKFERVIKESIIKVFGSTFEEFVQSYRSTGVEANVEDYVESDDNNVAEQITEDVGHLIDSKFKEFNFVDMFGGRGMKRPAYGLFGEEFIMAAYVLNMFRERGVEY